MRTPKQAVAASLATHHNVPRSCQFTTRIWLDAPSAGDFDGDGMADAEDGWKKEPATARRFDRNPPAGYPVYYSGGSQDNGHRALSLGHGKIRSTDAGGSGVTATVDLDWPERNWGLKYGGWSTTMDGVPIPPDKKPKPLTKGWRVKRAEKLIKNAHSKPGTRRAKILERIANLLAKVPKT
jgi:hypothetical protein